MANTYKPLSARGIALYGKDVLELDLNANEERDLLESGHVSIEPRPYEVLSNNYSAGEQGDVVDLALVVENEAALIEGGHIARHDKPAKKAAAKKADAE